MASQTGLIEFNIVGDRHGVQEMLDIVDSALSPQGLSVFFHGMVEPFLKQRAKARFENEGDDVSGKWAPLSEATVEIREGAGFGGSHPINVRTHELERYITENDATLTLSPLGASMSFPGRQGQTNAVREKMRTAQQGRTSPATVKRPVLGVNERDLSEVLVQLAFFVQGRGALRAQR